MWYFAWILGVTAALAFGVINVMWYEFQNEFDTVEAAPAHSKPVTQAPKHV